MKNLKSVLILLVVLSIAIIAGDAKNYGKEITLKEKTNISKILKSPENFVGKKVLVEGTVVSVCSHRGCWIELKSDKDYEKIRVKVKDGEIVFPMEAVGKTAVVEGEVTMHVVKANKTDCGSSCGDKKEKSSCSDKKEMKAEKTSDKKDGCCPTGDKKVYQIKGFGAKIS